jgi:hypothetical protein
MDGWVRNCPCCNRKIVYTQKGYYERALNKKTKCARCCKIGRVLSEEHKQKIATASAKRIVSDDTRKKISENNCCFWKGKFGKTHHSFGKTYGFGRKHSAETKKRMSLIQTALWKNPIIRKKRLSTIKWNNTTMDNGQLELLKKWDSMGFNFEPNYKLHTNDFLYFIDGYDKEHNVVMEYDSKYHRRKDIREKDLIRQNNIIKILNPKKFWRYDSVHKTWNDVLKGLK